MNHPLQESTINQIAQDILKDFIENQDVSDMLGDLACGLAEHVAPYDKNSKNNDVHVVIAGAIMMELEKYLKLGYKIHNETVTL